MKLTIHLGILSAINIGILFFYQWYVMTQLGPGVETDALFAGMTVPQLMLAVISGSLMHALVPIFSGESEESIRLGAWSLLALISCLFSMLAVFLFVMASWWVPVIVPGFSEAGMNLTTELTRIQLIGMIFSAINGVQWAIYHARHQFIWAEFAPLLASLTGILLLIWALPRFGIVAAAWISVFRLAIQTLLLAPGMGRPVRPDLKNDVIIQAWQRVKPLLIGTAYYKTDSLVDRLLLSMAGSGSLSLYYIAQQIYGAVGHVLNKAITAPMVPKLSMLHKTGDSCGLQRTYYQKLVQMWAISLVGVLILVVFGHVILDLMVGYGRLSESKVIELWWIMVWLCGIFVGGIVGQIAASSFYACGDTKTPTRLSMINYTVYIPCKIMGFYLWGVMGLAVITSLYYMVNLSLLLYYFRKKFIL